MKLLNSLSNYIYDKKKEAVLENYPDYMVEQFVDRKDLDLRKLDILLDVAFNGRSVEDMPIVEKEIFSQEDLEFALDLNGRSEGLLFLNVMSSTSNPDFMESYAKRAQRLYKGNKFTIPELIEASEKYISNLVNRYHDYLEFANYFWIGTFGLEIRGNEAVSEAVVRRMLNYEFVDWLEVSGMRE